MEYFLLKVLLICLVSFTTFTKDIKCQCGEIGRNVSANSAGKNESYFMFGKIFDQGSTIKIGDSMQCEVTESKSQEYNKNDIYVFTQSTNSGSGDGYVFYPASKNKKCFSFQVRTKHSPHILLSATQSVVNDQRLEVILEYVGNPNSVIRIKDFKPVATTQIKGLVNDRELRGFWIRWLDDYLLEFGRDTDNYPILSYRLPEKLSVNFIAILSNTNTGEWILHEDPHCGAYNITKKIEVETKCKLGTTKFNAENNKVDTTNLNYENNKFERMRKLDPIKNNTLQISQQHILKQIKKQHEIFKASKFRSKEILLEYQQLIRKHFRKAEENQNKIYDAENTEFYCPLKAITFDEIMEEYFQFLEELQMELAMFKHIPVVGIANVSKEYEHNSGSCCCSILQN